MLCLWDDCDVEIFTNVNRMTRREMRNINVCPACKRVGYLIIKGQAGKEPQILSLINARTDEPIKEKPDILNPIHTEHPGANGIYL